MGAEGQAAPGLAALRAVWNPHVLHVLPTIPRPRALPRSVRDTLCHAVADPATIDSMDLLLIGGVSGSGKSVALAALEDSGYYAVSNLPLTQLSGLLSHL